MLLITLDKQGQTVKKEELFQKGYPRNGVERKKDGNFYKILDDPRCISHIEMQEGIRKKKEEDEESKKRLLHSAVTEAAENLCKHHPAYPSFPTILACPKQFSAEGIKNLIKRKTLSYAGPYHATYAVYYKCSLRENIDLITIDRIDLFERIEVHPKYGHMKMWVKNPCGNPDYLVTNILRPLNENSHLH